jgi:hypothetical protein
VTPLQQWTASVRGARRDSPVDPQEPLSRAIAARALARCIVQSAGLLAKRRTHLPKDHVGLRLSFADGTTGTVFRETIVDRPPPADPCLLVVEFRLRFLKGRWHSLFLWECILNTPLFVGFPGLVSKLWVDHDQEERYRGFYEWDGPANAKFYARSLWRVLELVCPRGAIHYMVVPGMRRDEVLDNPKLLERAEDCDAGTAWWRLIAAES